MCSGAPFSGGMKRRSARIPSHHSQSGQHPLQTYLSSAVCRSCCTLLFRCESSTVSSGSNCHRRSISSSGRSFWVMVWRQCVVTVAMPGLVIHLRAHEKRRHPYDS
jgi:hypothetical protein